MGAGATKELRIFRQFIMNPGQKFIWDKVFIKMVLENITSHCVKYQYLMSYFTNHKLKNSMQIKVSNWKQKYKT